MAQQPRWITPAGSLGVIAEGLFFKQVLIAEDPDGGSVTYGLIAGSLPSGVQVRTNGTIEGTPTTTAYSQGVPTEVNQNVTSTFAVRAYSPDGTRINDRTFEITVTGQDAPEFTTPAGSIGSFIDGEPVTFTFAYTDPDPGDTVTITLEDGNLPPGLSLSTSGVLSGYILPELPLPEDVGIGYDASEYDEYAWDFTARSIDRNYEFTLKISDGKEYSLRVFSVYVVSADTLSADTDEITADTMEVTADANNDRRPFITNYPPNGDIGTYRHDNFFAYQFEALDLDNEPIAWEIVAGDSSDIPPGLFFNQDNGWLTGYLPNQGATEITYSFSIFVRAANPPYTEGFSYDYTMTVIGDIADAVTWISPQQLGTIKTGSPSLFAIEAVAQGGQILQFRLKPGSYPDIPGVYNKLPQGLKLLPSGSISGRVSFNGFSLDEGTTTFDEQLQTRLEINPTTFDSTFNFTVNAYSADGLISVNRTFTIVVDRDSYAPYENIYIEAMPVQADRSLVQSLVQNRDIFPPSSIYRNEDPYFGVQQSVKYIHTFGLATATLEEYLVALEENHFRKRLVLGEIKTAQALDSSGNVEYEVVYSEIVDTGVNQDGESPGQTVNVAYPFTYNGETISKVYPNSLINMRDRVVDTIGSESNYLPLWMTSKQSDGRVLGFTKAWVIAYTKPGESARIAYNVRTEFGEILNRVDWIADRYILDKELTKNWVVNPDSTDGGSWLPASETTFDFDEAYGPDSTNLEASTTFDGDSLRFISPVDQWSFTDEYNKYLVFPKTNILG